jgi:cytochrome c-type biogenesis protein CcmE
MRYKAVRLGLTGLVLTLAFGGLLYSTLSEGTEYYKHVDEVMVDPLPWHGKKMQLHGWAADVRQKPGRLEYRFDVESNGSVVTAYYDGIVPDTFKNGSEVVLKGTLGPDGFHVQPDGVMAKCPSKYDATSPTVSPDVRPAGITGTE